MYHLKDCVLYQRERETYWILCVWANTDFFILLGKKKKEAFKLEVFKNTSTFQPHSCCPGLFCSKFNTGTPGSSSMKILKEVNG